MTMPKINKNMLLVVALIIVLIAGYFTFFRKSDTTGTELVDVGTNLGVPAVGQELLIELNRLNALKSINKDIFTDPVFVSLKDFTQNITPEPLGRSNPFAPIGSE